MCCYCCAVFTLVCVCIQCLVLMHMHMHAYLSVCTHRYSICACVCVFVHSHVCGGGCGEGPQGPALCLSHLPPHSADTQGNGIKGGEFILAKRDRGPVA